MTDTPDVARGGPLSDDAINRIAHNYLWADLGEPTTPQHARDIDALIAHASALTLQRDVALGEVAELHDVLVAAAGELGGCAGYICGLRDLNLANADQDARATHALQLVKRIVRLFPPAAPADAPGAFTHTIGGDETL